jgi:hypothetical protein
MNKEQQAILQQLASTGAFDLIQLVVDEIKKEIQDVSFENDPYKLAYEMGKRDGAKDVLDYLMEKLNNYRNA